MPDPSLDIFRFRRVFRPEFCVSFLFLITFLFSCSSKIRGEFGWSSADDREMKEPEKSLLIENDFRLARENLYFFDHETIWWVYQIRQGSYEPDGFLAALYENNNTPEPVEIELRQVPIQVVDGIGFIRQHYDPLPLGRYLLKIAHESNVIDEVQFQIVPIEGPSELNESNEIENKDRDIDSDVDEIQFYSS